MKRKRVFATLKVLRSVLEQLDKDIPEEVSSVAMLMWIHALLLFFFFWNLVSISSVPLDSTAFSS